MPVYTNGYLFTIRLKEAEGGTFAGRLYPQLYDTAQMAIEKIHWCSNLNESVANMTTFKKEKVSARLFLTLTERASEEKTRNVVQCLDEGADINDRFINCINHTPLHISVIMNDINVATLLLMRGAKTNLKNSEGNTALDIAKRLHAIIGKPFVDLLEKYEHKTQTNIFMSVLANTNETQEYFYEKRTGVTGIKGQLYEVKLITLILTRLSINMNEFYLGSNLKDIGALDDVCVRYKQNYEDIVVFLQSKYRNDITKRKVTTEDLWRQTGEFSFFKYFDSYLKIRNKFNKTNKNDPIFTRKFENVKPYFILHTSAGNELKTVKIYSDHPTDIYVRHLIQSGEYSDVFKYRYTDREVVKLARYIMIEDIKSLGKALCKLIQNNNFNNILNESIIRKYHIVLARSVFDVSDVNKFGYRTATFCKAFLSNDDELLLELKKAFIDEVLKNNKHCNKKFKCSTNVFDSEMLSSIYFKLPARFGNIDLGVSRRRRLEHLASKMEKVVKHFDNKFVIINDDMIGPDKMVDSGMMDLHGGFGSAIGNLLIYCEENQVFKFNTNHDNLGPNSKTLLELLSKKIPGLETYKLKFDIAEIPKLSLQYDDSLIKKAKEFLDTLWIYTNQAKEEEIDEYAIGKIKDHCIPTERGHQEALPNSRYDAIYLNIHDKVLKWWISKGQIAYLTNGDDLLNNIVEDMFGKSILRNFSDIYENQILNHDIEFNLDAVESLGQTLSSDCTENVTDYVIFNTEVITLIGIKLVQYFSKKNNYSFVDLESYVLLSKTDIDILIKEVKCKMLESLIVIYDNVSEMKNELFRDIIKDATPKQLIIVTNSKLFENLQSNLSNKCVRNMSDEKIEFNNLTSASQVKVLKNKLIFQGNEIDYGKLLNENAKNLLKSTVLQRVIKKQILNIGQDVTNGNCEESKGYYYVDPKLSFFITLDKENVICYDDNKDTESVIQPKTFEEIKDIAALVSNAGTGKSTFLTHLSIATKKQYPDIWIERINLLDYTKELRTIQKKELDIDHIQALKLVCKAILFKSISKNIAAHNSLGFDSHFKMEDGKLKMNNYEEKYDLDAFELEVFINCYNKGKVIFLFDDFDEVCLHYKDAITKLLLSLTVVSVNGSAFTGSILKHSIWIASRSYNNIAQTLETEFCSRYGLASFNYDNTIEYITKFLKASIDLHALSLQQLENINWLFEYVETNADSYVEKVKLPRNCCIVFLLNRLYFTAVNHFKREIECINLRSEKKQIAENRKASKLCYATKAIPRRFGNN